MASSKYHPTHRLLMQTSGFQVVQVADNAIMIIRSRRSYRRQNLVVLFACCFMGGLGYMAVTISQASIAFYPAKIVGAALVLFGGIGAIDSLLGVIGFGQESWRVTPNLVQHRKGISFKRKAVNKIVEVQKDSKINRRYLCAAKQPGSYLFWDQVRFDVSDSLEELTELGHLVSQFSGWPYVESEMDLRSGGAGGVGGP